MTRHVCIIQPQRSAYSQTFLHAHEQRLPATVQVLYGGVFPRYHGDDELLFPPVGLVRRVMRKALHRALKLPWNYYEKIALKRFLSDNRIEVVLAEYGPTGVAVMDACQEADIPLVVHFHGFDAYQRIVFENEGRYYKELFEKAAAVISVSHHMEERLLHLGVPREKLHYNPCGADVTEFQGARPSQAPPWFLAVGRFVSKKAPYLTLLAFQDVLKNVPNAKLTMVGDGPLREVCQKMSNALGIEASVAFPGVLPPDRVVAHMQEARAFVQHSVTTSDGDSEGTPVAILEAGATGLPVVATQHGGIVDVIVEGETGFLVAEGDVLGMASRMLELARNPVLAEQVGKKARGRIVDCFSMAKSVANLWRIIEGVLGRHEGC